MRRTFVDTEPSLSTLKDQWPGLFSVEGVYIYISVVNFLQLKLEYELLFQKSPDAAISTLTAYGKKKGGALAVLKKGDQDVVVSGNQINQPAHPIIIKEGDLMIIQSENVAISQTKDESLAVFLFVLVHYAMNVQMAKGLDKALKSLTNKFFK